MARIKSIHLTLFVVSGASDQVIPPTQGEKLNRLQMNQGNSARFRI